MKRIISVVLLACLLCGMLAGCKAKKQANSATDVEVIYWETGYGRAWLDAVIKNFNDSQDQYHATLVSSAENRASEISRGDATGDLYIGSWNTHHAYKEYLYPLDEVLATKVDGEDGLTLGEKFGNFVEDNRHLDGHIYSIPGVIGSLNAIMYNVNMMVDSTGTPYKLPNTTDELVKLCLDLYSDGKTPFVYYPEYWDYMWEAWTAQYEGDENYMKIWKGIYVDENGVEHENDVRAITESKGRYEAYKVLEDLLSPKGYAYTNTNSFSHTTSQTYFLAGYAAMQPNGSWIENEMGGSDTTGNILPMKTPVLSAVADKLGIRSDKHLSLIVDYVDGVQLDETALAVVNSYSAEVIEEVRKDRNTYFNGEPQHTLIPNYSNCIDGALELLKYIYSDEGVAIASAIIGAPAGLKYSGDVAVDDSSWSPFMRECNRLMKEGNVIILELTRPIYYMTGVQHLTQNDPVRAMTYRTDGGILNADQYWEKETAAWEAKWSQMLTDAGLQ